MPGLGLLKQAEDPQARMGDFESGVAKVFGFHGFPSVRMAAIDKPGAAGAVGVVGKTARNGG
ncbi:hypothetical protein GCM10027431_11600 [Lysobacter rhizosphaerae]